MKASRLVKELVARPMTQMVSVTEHDLAAHVSQLARIDTLHGSLGTHWHKHGCINDLVR